MYIFNWSKWVRGKTANAMAPSQHRKLCSECERLESNTTPNITANYQNLDTTVLLLSAANLHQPNNVQSKTGKEH